MADDENIFGRETVRPGDRPRDRPSSPPPAGGEAGASERPPRESTFPGKRVEKALRDALKRALEKGLEAGIGTLSKTDEALRGALGDAPKELVNYAFGQVEETKNALVRVVAREVRDFLHATDVAKELQKALTSLSFEIKTEIRFIPNDAGGVKPDVRASVIPKRVSGE